MDVSLTPKVAVAVTTSDTAPNVGVGFQVAVAGNVALEFSDLSQATLPACAAGSQYSIQFTKILATGTTATGIVKFN